MVGPTNKRVWAFLALCLAVTGGAIFACDDAPVVGAVAGSPKDDGGAVLDAARVSDAADAQAPPAACAAPGKRPVLTSTKRTVWLSQADRDRLGLVVGPDSLVAHSLDADGRRHVFFPGSGSLGSESRATPAQLE